MHRFRWLVMGGFLAMALAPASGALPEEMLEARLWVAAKLQGVQAPRPREAGLVALDNHDPVQKNARAGRPMNIAGRQFTRGLYCHAVSRLVVRLPGPARTFSAIAGVDSNDQTSGGRGSVVFSVLVRGAEVFHTGVMREGMPGVPVNVNLNGADEFILAISDAGDGIACDQADWADARVILADGRTLWLADLPLVEGLEPGPYTTEPPFSFTYGGRPSADLLPAWRVERQRRDLDSGRVQHLITYTDPETGLVVRCAATEYRTYPTVEWVVTFRNNGAKDTPILEGIQALDARFERGSQGEWVLHHHTGSPCTPTDYRPFADPLPPSTEKRVATSGGRSSNSDFPYFGLESPNGGVLLAVGWPGQWAASFARDAANGLRVRAGQELTRFVLRPGEEVRTPLIVLQFWQGDRIRAHNTWRRWMLAYNLPRPHGKPVAPQMAACSSHQFGEMIHANEQNQKLFIDRYLQEKLPLDYWWMDAGWYPNQTGWPNTGTWEVDTQRFPRGLRAITDHAHAKGVKSIVWFEPERVTPGTWLYEKHPEWLLGRDGDQKLLNLGHPEARRWLVEHIDRLIVEQGIDLYRQDFNIDPLPYWRSNDAEDRQGITEIRYVEGFLAFWDELRRRHPNMLIDTCASGGRRNDLETLRRSVPLLRSDYILEPVGQQNHTYGLSFWVPFYGTGVNTSDPYVFRSQMCPHITGCWDVRRTDLDYGAIRRRLSEWKRVAPLMLGDYAPLTPYRTEDDVWVAWQFYRPDLGEGMVQAFRRAESIYESARFPLRGLDPSARYAIRDLDSPAKVTEASGQDLMDKGLLVTVGRRPGAALVLFTRVTHR